MAKLTRLELVNIHGTFEIRAVWDNDRHQRLDIRSLDSDEVIYALKGLAHIIEGDKREGHI